MENEHLYPGIARRMMPHIDETLDMFGDDPSEEELGRMTTHLVNRSGAHMDPPPSVNDFARWLILARLAEESGFPVYPFPPFWFFPPVGPPPRRGRPRRRR